MKSKDSLSFIVIILALVVSQHRGNSESSPTHERRTSLRVDSYYSSEDDDEDYDSVAPTDYKDLSLVPEFDSNVIKNITSVKGKTTKLYCKVNNLGNKSISWLKHDNLHILTVGRYTYTSDSRFEPVNPEGTNEWILKIRNSANADSGVYECQISTQPVKSFFVNLRVVTPIASILGKNEMFVDVGSTINITCTVHHTPEPPTSIKWLHDGEPIDYTSMRGGISVLTNKAETTVSSLIIQLATPNDGGEYSCQAGEDLEPARVKVHVFDGDNIQSLHTNDGNTILAFFSIFPISCITIPLLLGSS